MSNSIKIDSPDAFHILVIDKQVIRSTNSLVRFRKPIDGTTPIAGIDYIDGCPVIVVYGKAGMTMPDVTIEFVRCNGQLLYDTANHCWKQPEGKLLSGSRQGRIDWILRDGTVKVLFTDETTGTELRLIEYMAEM